MAATFKFYIREDRPDSRGQCPIYLRITHSRKLKYLHTGIRVHPSEWSDPKEKLKTGNRFDQDRNEKLNLQLEKIRNNAVQAYLELKEQNRDNADSIKKRVEYSHQDNFFGIAKEHLEEIKQNNQYYTHRQRKAAIEKFKRFHGSDNLPINSVDASMLMDYQKYLKQTVKNQASTILKNFTVIKRVLEMAVDRELIPSNPLDSKEFKPIKKKSSSTKTKLTIDQIQALEELNLDEGSNLWHARNAFMLSFYFCGMRFGDLAELKWENVKSGRLSYRMSKTETDISIPIKEGAREILNHYKEQDNNGYIFPFLADLKGKEQKDPEAVRKKISTWNAVVNGQDSGGKLSGLKAIASMAEIDEPVSMHVARHSFAQYGVNDKDIPPYKMMMLLGHKSIKTTMVYLKSLDLKTVDNVMDEIF
jgi:site-specific recombinase XerD